MCVVDEKNHLSFQKGLIFTNYLHKSSKIIENHRKFGNSFTKNQFLKKTNGANIRINDKLELFDANNTIDLVAGNPRWTMDGGDFLEFNRTGGGGFGELTFRINGVPNPELSIQQGLVTINNTLFFVDNNTSILR